MTARRRGPRFSAAAAIASASAWWCCCCCWWCCCISTMMTMTMPALATGKITAAVVFTFVPSPAPPAALRKRRRSRRPLFLSLPPPSSSTGSSSSSSSPAAAADAAASHHQRRLRHQGLYRPIAEMVWDKLTAGWLELEECEIPENLRYNSSPAKGMPAAADGGEYVVKIETRAMQHRKVAAAAAAAAPAEDGGQKASPPPPLCYARMALLETVPATATTTTTAEGDSDDNDDDDDDDDSSSTVVHSAGIQVLNLVLFPSKRTTLPVWGADFVSLPGNRHLLLLDAQPMNGDRSHEPKFAGWYYGNDEHGKGGIPSLFKWGGDMPEQVRPFVSKHALWTRWGTGGADHNGKNGTSSCESGGGDEKKEEMSIPSLIQGPLAEAVRDHLDLYLELLKQQQQQPTSADCGGAATGGNATTATATDYQQDYIRYRLENDPARPMLRSLYGDEWTENVLSQVLFPQQ